MANFTIVAPPLNDVRVAVYKRLDEDANTSSYNLLEEGRPIDFPYLAVGPVYLGRTYTDPDLGATIIVQVEAYAAALAGGTFKVAAMGTDVYEAFSASGITITGFQVLAPIIEQDIINPNLQDPVSNEFYAQRIMRFQFIVTS